MHISHLNQLKLILFYSS